MVDLKKKPLPDPRRELVMVLAKIAEKREKEELFRAIEAESKRIQKYKKSWTKSVVTALLTVVWIPVITLWEKSSSFWELSYMWGVPITALITLFYANIAARTRNEIFQRSSHKDQGALAAETALLHTCVGAVVFVCCVTI